MICLFVIIRHVFPWFNEQDACGNWTLSLWMYANRKRKSQIRGVSWLDHSQNKTIDDHSCRGNFILVQLFCICCYICDKFVSYFCAIRDSEWDPLKFLADAISSEFHSNSISRQMENDSAIKVNYRKNCLAKKSAHSHGDIDNNRSRHN